MAKRPKSAKPQASVEVKETKAPKKAGNLPPTKGKLGVMIPGMGAVATTFVAGVEAVRKGISKPIGSLTQMGTVRLGKRTEGRSPKIKEFVPLAGLDDLVFTGWDIFEDNMYDAATNAGVLDRYLLEQIKPFLSGSLRAKPSSTTTTSRRSTDPTSRRARPRWTSPNRCARTFASSASPPALRASSPSGVDRRKHSSSRQPLINP